VYQSDTPEHIDAEVAAPEPAGDDLAEELIAADTAQCIHCGETLSH